MSLVVCPLQNLKQQIALAAPARIVTLLAPNQPVPDTPPSIPRLTLAFHDVDAPRRGLTPPDRAMIEALVAFAAAWSEPGPMLIHCWMGISRSTAAALIVAAALQPGEDELDLARRLRAASPTATPNPLMIELADDILQRGGRLIKATAAIGRGVEAACGVPFRLGVRP